MASPEDFLDAQNKHWPQILAELREGQKVTHWIWYVFPQLRILGRSGMARHFGIFDLEEASAYLSHPVLGPRLEEVASLLLAHAGTDPVEILGPVDALKVKSSMTLFEAVPDAPATFSQVLNSLYSGARCQITQDALG